MRLLWQGCSSLKATQHSRPFPAAFQFARIRNLNSSGIYMSSSCTWCFLISCWMWKRENNRNPDELIPSCWQKSRILLDVLILSDDLLTHVWWRPLGQEDNIFLLVSVRCEESELANLRSCGWFISFTFKIYHGWNFFVGNFFRVEEVMFYLLRMNGVVE